RTKLAARDRRGHQVGRSRQTMDVRVKTARSPGAFELDSVLLEGQVKGLDRGVQLRGETYGIEPETRERMVGLSLEKRVQVVHDLHAAGIQRRGAGGPRQDRHLRALTTGSQRCA